MRPLHALAACVALAALWPAPAHGGDIRIGGRVSTAFQVGLIGCSGAENCRFLNFRNANVVGLTLDGQPSSTTEFLGDISVRNINFARIETLDDTGEISAVQPVDIRVNEARVSLFDLFGAKGLDVSAGALRVPWGEGDGISPNDVVNPFDLEEGAAFDKRLSSLAFQLGLSISDLRAEVVVVPVFMPAILPIEHIDFTALGDPQEVFDLAGEQGDPPTIEQVDTPTKLPEASLKNVQVGARIKYSGSFGDVALMFFRGFESLPQASGAVRFTGYQTQNRVDIAVPLKYPRVAVAGISYRGPLADRLSIWADVAVTFPQAHRLTASENQLEALVNLGRLDELPDPIPSQSTQTDDVYVKGVVGLENIFADQLYVNVQYSRGTPTERQAADIHNYTLLALRWTLLDGKLNIGARGALELTDDGDAAGYQAGGSISWLHGDAAELRLSTTFLGGSDEGTFGRFDKLSNVRLAFKTSF